MKKRRWTRLQIAEIGAIILLLGITFNIMVSIVIAMITGADSVAFSWLPWERWIEAIFFPVAWIYGLIVLIMRWRRPEKEKGNKPQDVECWVVFVDRVANSYGPLYGFNYVPEVIDIEKMAWHQAIKAREEVKNEDPRHERNVG